jgi:hypothetical protein
MSTPLGSALNPRYPYTTRVEDASPSVRYVGELNPGNPVDPALPQWRIRRESTLNTGVSVIEYANGGHFNAIWNNRSSYFDAPPTGPGLTMGFEPQTFDQVTFTYNVAGFIDTMAYRYNGSAVRLLTFTYDGSNRLIDVSKTDY